MTLQGGRVVVIGGSSGSGLVTARLAKDEGAEVAIAGRSQEKLVQAQQEMGKVHTAVMDTTDEGGVEKVFAGLSRVDHVLISAGTIRKGAIVDNDLATLRHIVDERLWGLMYVVRHAAPRMPQGSIAFTSGGCRRAPPRECHADRHAFGRGSPGARSGAGTGPGTRQRGYPRLD